MGRGPVCQKSPGRTTCAYGRDTYREICRRECARPKGRVRGSAANFVPWGKHSDRVLWTKQGAVFGAALQFSQGRTCGPPGKLAKRKRAAVCLLQGRRDARRKSREPQSRNFCHAHACRNGFPLKRVVFRHARPRGRAGLFLCPACLPGRQRVRPKKQAGAEGCEGE